MASVGPPAPSAPKQGQGLERDIGDVSASMKFATMFLLSAFVIGPDISGGNRAPVELSPRPFHPQRIPPMNCQLKPQSLGLSARLTPPAGRRCF